MKTHEEHVLSNCCEYKVSYCPPSLYEEGFYVCRKCSSETFVHIDNVQVMEKIGRGHYRKIDNVYKGIL